MAKVITLDEFIDQYKPIKNHLDTETSFNGCLFETFSLELVFVQDVNKTKPYKVWTVMDDDSIVSGYHFVNRVGHLITEVEYTEHIEVPKAMMDQPPPKTVDS